MQFCAMRTNHPLSGEKNNKNMKKTNLPKASDAMRLLVNKLNADYNAILRSGDENRAEELRLLETKINELLESYDFDYSVFSAEDGKEGIRTCGGTTIVPPVYDKILYWSLMDPSGGPENAVARRGDRFVLINLRDGREVLEADMINPSDQTLTPVVFTVAGKKGLADSKGNMIVPPRYDSISMLMGGFYEIGLNGKYGLCLPDGNIIETKFDALDCEESEEYFKVVLDGQKGFIDENGDFTEDESNAFFGAFYM